MKRRRFAALAALLLCLSACRQENRPLQPFPEAPPPVTRSQLLSAACPVETRAFQQTESFPFPFDDPWLTVEENGKRVPALTLEQALYDYDTLWRLLEENYPFFPALQREGKVYWESVRDENRRLMADNACGGILPLTSFAYYVKSALANFQGAGHLSILSGELRDSLGSGQEKSAPFPQIRSVVNTQKVKAFCEAWDRANGTAEAVPPEKQAPMPGVTLDWVEGIPCIAISSFMNWTEETGQQFSDCCDAIMGAEHLILDIRGNGGGSTRPWQSMIVPRLLGKDYEREVVLGIKDGSLNRFLLPGLTKLPPYDWAVIQEKYPDADPDCMAGIDRLLISKIRTYSDELPERPFSGKIWLLVDEGVYSAADAFAGFCKDTGIATLVGRETGGNGVGANPFVLALPYSGLCVYYEPYLGLNADGTCNGVTGTKPDIAARGDALQICLEAIAAGK